jgi:predicted MFS family arabinose efflux permease
MSSAPVLSDSTKTGRLYGGYAIGLLVLINMVNYMDRMVLSVLLPDIKADLGLTDSQLGWLTGMAFAFFYATFGLPLARLADVWVRKHIISLALVGWSAMTMVSGAATSFTTLLLARVGVGIGESGCIPPSHSLIADLTQPEKRAGAMAWHTAGATMGIMAGLVVGGWLAGQVGWRWTFVIVGAPGILLALVMTLTFREPRRQTHGSTQDGTDQNGFGQTIGRLIRVASYRHLLMAFGTAVFASYGLMQWLPSYYMRTFDLSPGAVGILFGLVLGVGSTIGTIGGGYLANYLMKRDLRWGAWLPFIAVVSGVPFLFVTLLSNSLEIALSANLAQAIVAGVANGPIMALIQTVVRARERAVASALVMFAASLIGVGAGPVVVGYLSDGFTTSGAENPLRLALLVASAFPLWSGVHLLFVTRTLRLDAARVGELDADEIRT